MASELRTENVGEVVWQPHHLLMPVDHEGRGDVDSHPRTEAVRLPARRSFSVKRKLFEGRNRALFNVILHHISFHRRSEATEQPSQKRGPAREHGRGPASSDTLEGLFGRYDNSLRRGQHALAASPTKALDVALLCFAR